MVGPGRMRIYLDYNATAPVVPEATAAMTAALSDRFGNPSSLHYFGQGARALLDSAREEVAALIGANPVEIVFTSGGTESDNFAIRGVAEAAEGRGRRHLVSTAIEHEAVLHTVRALSRRGWDTTIVPVGESGIVTPSALESALRPDTALVTVMHANNEVGTVQPIAELAALAHATGAVFHTDAVQTVGRITVDVRALGVDLLSLSGHKLGAPKGIGALWIRRGTKLSPLMTGGRQERNRRPGTENVPAAAGLGAAARVARNTLGEQGRRLAALRDRLEAGVLAEIPGVAVNGDPLRRLPGTSNMSFEGVEAEALLIALDLEGVAVSTGSACSSGTLEPSHVLRAMGLGPHRVQSALRLSLGAGTTAEEIDRVVGMLPDLVARIRSRSGRTVGARSR
jgi:cysteine desulfurase